MAAAYMAVNSGPTIWAQFKDLYHIVDATIIKKMPNAFHDLEIALRKHKPDFISLLKNPAKNPVHRERVKKANSEGIIIHGQDGIQILPNQLIEEALIVSDLFDLNEIGAVELLIAGEQQLPYYPGLTRGLVAVLLYYDGCRNLINSLRALIQACEGRTWTLGLGEELVSLCNKFVNQLVEEGLINNIFELFDSIDLTKELDKLQKERALGGPKHRKQVTDLIKEIRQSLAECIFCRSCQSSLNKADSLRLLGVLKSQPDIAADGTLDSVVLALFMSFLYCIDVSILDQAEEGDELVKKLPLLSDLTLLPTLHKQITSDQEWKSQGLEASIQFSWSLTLQSLLQHMTAQGFDDCIEDDEIVMNAAIEGNVFFFLQTSIVRSPSFLQEEFYIRRMHSLIADFITHMPLKVKELRNRGDETARIIMAHVQEGLEPPHNLPRHFEHFLQLVAELYSKDLLHLELALEYWCPTDPTAPTQNTAIFTSLYRYQPPQRQVSLFKFVRLAGDLLLPSLYIPYVNMLKSLANGPNCAHHCYNLLKVNGLTAGGQYSTISWDHFFMSLNRYYTNLRQEVLVGSDTRHLYHHPNTRGITPKELEGLTAVLQMMQCIAEQDEQARLALCENQQWVPIVLLLGLIGCSIPPTLKAELLLTLSAFAKSSEIAISLWQSLEMSQILQTIKSTSVHHSGGIQIELDEIEARNEEYCMTRAFLNLLNSLTNIPVPPGLGAGYRAPGFDPYLEFIRDSVFLKFNTRAYRNPGEKWEIACACLDILYKLLRDYEVTPEDFIDQPVELQGGGSTIANKLPGYHILTHMLHDGGMLKMILFIIDEATILLDQYIPFPGKDSLQKSSLLCLKMIELTLEKQNHFLFILRESGSSLLVSSLDKLLMGINPRSGRADHLFKIAKYITYNSWLCEHVLSSIKILCLVCQSPVVQPELVGMFTANEPVSRELLCGFVECLEVEDSEEISDDIPKSVDLEESPSYLRNSIRQNIMRLLLYSLDQATPNIAHYLLGFQLRKPVSKTTLQNPGVLGSPRTCLHSILSLLDHGVDSRNGPTCIYEIPVFTELAYQTIYALSFSKDTSNPTMRYLRTAHDFLDRHLRHVPFKIKKGVSKIQLLNQQSWLLRTVAIELKLTSSNRQRSHTQRLLNLLLDTTPDVFNKKTDRTIDGDVTLFNISNTISQQLTLSQTLAGSQARRKLLSLLDSLDFCQDFPEQLQLEYFNQAAVHQVVTSCEQKNEQGVMLCVIKNLYKILQKELNNLQGSALNQRPVVQQEIQKILKNVVKQNSYRLNLYSKRQAFEAWRQMTEIILTACPLELLEGENRLNVILELLQDLLKQSLNKNALSELIAPIAGVILTLLANLRQCIYREPSLGITSQETSQFVSLLDRTTGQDNKLSDISLSQYSSSFLVVLRGLIDSIMKTDASMQRVRANYYGALLFYLKIAQKPKELSTLETDIRSTGVSMIGRETEHEKLNKENVSLIQSYGDNFLEIICRDACDGHDVGKMLALATLDALISSDRQQQWLSYMTIKGYIRHIIESMLQSDKQLQDMLGTNPEAFRVLYVYESKMALLTKIGESVTGAQCLLQNRLMERLAECQTFDLRPEQKQSHSVLPNIDETEMHISRPNIMQRYRQIFFPALKLCLAILTSLGSENREATTQVLRFILAHADVFNSILRDKVVGLHLPSLQELSLATAVIGRTLAEDVINKLMENNIADVEVWGHINRIERQMLTLLVRYCMTDQLKNQLRNISDRIRPDGTSLDTEIEITIQEIATNVVAFCRRIVSRSGNNAQSCRILFGPSLMESSLRDSFNVEDYQTTLINPMRPPGLGIIVHHLKQCANEFMQVMERHKQHVRKLEVIYELSSEELQELLIIDGSEKMSTQQKQQVAKRRLTQIIEHTTNQIHLYAYMVENILFLLWRHLEFYLIYCVPVDQKTHVYQLKTHKYNQPLRRLTEYSDYYSDDYSSVEWTSQCNLSQMVSGVSQEDLEELQKGIRSSVNESLFKKLQEIEECYAKKRTRYGYLQALVRRLERLIALNT